MPEVIFMTPVQEAASIMADLPIKSQQLVGDLLKAMSGYSESADMPDIHEPGFKRTCKSDFVLRDDFDELSGCLFSFL